ncbi:hypothetical protein [Streptomyces chartreusis]
MDQPRRKLSALTTLPGAAGHHHLPHPAWGRGPVGSTWRAGLAADDGHGRPTLLV